MDTYNVENINQFFAGNGQMFRETLLRASTEHCTNYATDICILLEPQNAVLNQWITDGGTLLVGFRDFGVEWSLSPALPEGYNYNHVIRLVRKGHNVRLFVG